MKRSLSAFFSVLLLAACGSSSSVTYNLTMNVTDAALRQDLADATIRVMERRLEAMGEVITDQDVQLEGSGAVITIEAEHEEALTALTEQLVEPFDFAILAQAEEGQKADITVDGHGGFVNTGITGADLQWVEGKKEAGSSFGEVKLIFTDEGRVKMADLFKRMEGKNIGLFVRSQLVSKLFVDTGELKDDILIREIPTAELAIVFADDVNVGTHVTFTPVP